MRPIARCDRLWPENERPLRGGAGRMKLAAMKLVMPVLVAAVSLSLVGCGDEAPGNDGGNLGGTGADASGGNSSGGSASGGAESSDGNTATGGNATGGDTGEFLEGSGTINIEFNGTAVEFDAYQAADFGKLGFITSSWSNNSETVDTISLYINPPSVGTFGCDDLEPTVNIVVQAQNDDDELTIFDGNNFGTCTITITEYGAVGEPMRGTFSAELTTFVGEVGAITNGTFELIRGSDR